MKSLNWIPPFYTPFENWADELILEWERREEESMRDGHAVTLKELLVTALKAAQSGPS